MWKMFCWGLLAGWLIEWIIDWLFWRKNTGPAQIAAASGTGMTGAALASGMASNVGASATSTAAAASTVATGFVPYKQDDLQAIEGIGPKIAELLKNNGITNFTQLSASPVEHLSKILDAGGSRFKLANPSTWAEQAGLAAKGDWAGFEKLKVELTAGVRMAKDDQ